jgi:hypothetical protein
MFNKIYGKFTNNNEKIPEKILKYTEMLDNNLNILVDNLYINCKHEKEVQFVTDNKEINDHSHKETLNKQTSNIPHYENNHNLQNLQNLQILNDQIENLNKIQNELKKILTENYKIKELKDDNELSKQSSEAVLIDRDELIDNNKLSPVINLNLENNLDDQDRLILMINENFAKINSLIKKIGETSKPLDHSSKFFFIN